ncbi:MAG: DUF6527 family protein [Vulcanimicrobiaceae bacterium]
MKSTWAEGVQVSPVLRKVERGFDHWCPACGELHTIFVPGWSFDGNLVRPTFNPSVKITGKQTVNVAGEWTGEWVRDAQGNPVDDCCHYFLHAGQLRFQGDCKHAFAGRTVPLPELPPNFRD